MANTNSHPQQSSRKKPSLHSHCFTEEELEAQKRQYLVMCFLSDRVGTRTLLSFQPFYILAATLSCWHCVGDAAENKLASVPALILTVCSWAQSSVPASSLCLMCNRASELFSSTPAQLGHKQLDGRDRIFTFDSFMTSDVLGTQQMFLGLNTKLKTKITLDAKHLFSAYIPQCVPQTSIFIGICMCFTSLL